MQKLYLAEVFIIDRKQYPQRRYCLCCAMNDKEAEQKVRTYMYSILESPKEVTIVRTMCKDGDCLCVEHTDSVVETFQNIEWLRTWNKDY